MSNSYVEWHSHDTYSMLDAIGHPHERAKRAAELGMSHLAISNHGNGYSLMKHWRACKENGVTPILGAEFYVSPTEDHRIRERQTWGTVEENGRVRNEPGYYTHLGVYALNPTGLRNLYKLHSRSHTEGFYMKPRISFDMLAEHSQGLFVLSGCAGSAISLSLRLGQHERAKKYTEFLTDVFSDRFAVEIMSHGIDFEAQLNSDLVDLAKRYNLPLLASNDVHYTLPNQAFTHECALAVGTGTNLHDPKRFKFPGTGYHLRDYNEMSKLGLPPQSIANTLYFAEMVESYDSVFESQDLMPKGDIDVLRNLAYRGLERLGDVASSSTYKERVEFELGVIEQTGFPGYFITMQRLISWAKQQGIRIGPARGSAGGCLVSYLLDITGIDPIQHGLLMERFLNPSRVSAPDIDVDVSKLRRDELLKFAVDEFGFDNVCQIITYGTSKTRAALKDAARVLDRTQTQSDALVRLVPPDRRGVGVPLGEITEVQNKDPEVYDLALTLEGNVRQPGKHAAGIIISPIRLDEFMPVKIAPSDDYLVSAFDMGELEQLGALKVDLLGLNTLDILDTAVNFIPGGLDLDKIPLDNHRAFNILAQGLNVGIFQLSEGWLKGVLKKLQPESFNDIVAAVALIRPGSTDSGSHGEYAERKKRGITKPSIHPGIDDALEPALRDTFGLVIYQEQVMEILSILAGWDYGRSEDVLKALGKKKIDRLAKAKPEFFKDAMDRGYDKEALEALWAVLQPFAEYSFNRSHAVGYGMIAYQTAYLKANYPAEFIASLMTHTDDLVKIKSYILEARRLGIDVLPPDINDSGLGFTPTRDGIRYGLAAIKGVGEASLRDLLSRRPFVGLTDFLSRAPGNLLNTRVFRALVSSGSLDSTLAGQSRKAGLLLCNERLSSLAVAHRKRQESGEHTLIPVRYPLEKNEDVVDYVAIAEGEKETIGIQLTHPTIVLKVPGTLTQSEASWLNTVLSSRDPVSPVVMDSGGFRVKLPVKSSERGLANAVAKLGIIVEVQ